MLTADQSIIRDFLYVSDWRGQQIYGSRGLHFGDNNLSAFNSIFDDLEGAG